MLLSEEERELEGRTVNSVAGFSISSEAVLRAERESKGFTLKISLP